jgi:hypothetical protein
MRPAFYLKVFVLLPFILFVDYLLMVLLGCASCLFGFGEEYYCGSFCLVGKILLVLSGAFFVFMVLPDIKTFISSKKHGKTVQK